MALSHLVGSLMETWLQAKGGSEVNSVASAEDGGDRPDSGALWDAE